MQNLDGDDSDEADDWTRVTTWFNFQGEARATLSLVLPPRLLLLIVIGCLFIISTPNTTHFSLNVPVCIYVTTVNLFDSATNTQTQP